MTENILRELRDLRIAVDGIIDRNEATEIQKDDEDAWRTAISSVLSLPALRGFWPMSPVAYTSPQALDVSGNGNHLTRATTKFGYDATSTLLPVSYYDGASRLFKADGGAGNWADVTGTEGYTLAAQRGLGIGTWVYFSSAIGGNEIFFSKRRAAAGNHSYWLRRTAAGNIEIIVSVDGTATTTATSAATAASNAWHYVHGWFDPSTALGINLDGEETTNVAAIPASIFDGTADFTLGGFTGTANFTGYLSMAWLSAALPDSALRSALFQTARAMVGV